MSGKSWVSSCPVCVLQWEQPRTLVQVQWQRGGGVRHERRNSGVRVLWWRVPPQSLWPMWVHDMEEFLCNPLLGQCEWSVLWLLCAANPYPDVRRRYWNAYMLFYQKISDQNSPVLPKKSRVSIMRQEAEDLTLWVKHSQHHAGDAQQDLLLLFQQFWYPDQHFALCYAVFHVDFPFFSQLCPIVPWCLPSVISSPPKSQQWPPDPPHSASPQGWEEGPVCWEDARQHLPGTAMFLTMLVPGSAFMSEHRWHEIHFLWVFSRLWEMRTWSLWGTETSTTAITSTSCFHWPLSMQYVLLFYVIHRIIQALVLRMTSLFCFGSSFLSETPKFKCLHLDSTVLLFLIRTCSWTSANKHSKSMLPYLQTKLKHADYQPMAKESLQLAVHFLFHTYLHTKKKLR